MALQSQTQRTFLFSFIGSIAVCGLVGIYCLIIGNIGNLQVRVLFTTLSVGGASILSLASAIPWERKRWPPLGLCVMIAVAIALGFIFIAIWLEPPRPNEWFYKLLAYACVFAVGLPHVGLLSLARLRRQFEWTRWATISVIATLAGQIFLSILIEVDLEQWYRFMGVLAIVDVCGTIAVPVLHRISGIRVEADGYVVAERAKISLTCPRCKKPQTLPMGKSQCPECKLKFSIEIEEEHCHKCGYLLYKVESAICPECGTAIVSQLAGQPVAQAAPQAEPATNTDGTPNPAPNVDTPPDTPAEAPPDAQNQKPN